MALMATLQKLKRPQHLHAISANDLRSLEGLGLAERVGKGYAQLTREGRRRLLELDAKAMPSNPIAPSATRISDAGLCELQEVARAGGSMSTAGLRHVDGLAQMGFVVVSGSTVRITNSGHHYLGNRKNQHQLATMPR